MTPLPPGSRIGILGGGQLGRMLSLAAAPLGYTCHIFGPEAAPPAGQVADRTIIADYHDEGALSIFAKDVDVVTLEFENVPANCVDFLEKIIPVRPCSLALSTAQDRLIEKEFATNIGAKTTPYRAIGSFSDLQTAMREMGPFAILKTRRMGYDGRGQVMLNGSELLEQAWQSLGAVPSILEGFISFDSEVSVIIARGIDGSVKAYPPITNRHRNHILDTSHVPSSLPEEQIKRAITIATKLSETLDYVGVLAVELFVKGDELLFNEFAPRVHNSGHWSIEGAVTSQFEQHIRAICGLPLGSTELLGRIEMTNLIGEEVNELDSLLAEPGAHLHLYGKTQARPNRKMGHITRVFPKTASQ